MKGSREAQLADGGLLPIVARDGVCFMPLSLSAPLKDQPPFDVLLHKLSDELQVARDGQLVFSDRVHKLQQFLQQHREICVVDPLQYTARVRKA